MASGSVLVFDMGGVLYDFQGARLIAETSRRRRRFRSEEVQAIWPALARGFETGCVSEEAFSAAVISGYDLDLSPSEFLTRFRDAAAGFYEGALDLLGELGQRHCLLSLSNTNPVQWQKVLGDLAGQDPFQAHHPSHVSGFHKPNRRAFDAIQAALPAQAQVHFFDDRSENVHAARALGWRAQRVRRVDGVRRACRELGLLP